MIDIHTHILPNVDDGARDMTEALQMARLAVEDGITHLFATPHHQPLYPTSEPLSRDDVADRVAELQTRLDEAHIPLTVLPGKEVRLVSNMFEDWRNEVAGPLGNSRYVLAEPLFEYYGRDTEAMLFELFDRGYTPVMAHPERIYPIQKDLSLIDPFLERGGLVQITAHSLTGYHGQRAKEVAEAMLYRGIVHIIASDAHRAHRRPPNLSTARYIAATIVGETQAEAMVTTTPLAILRDEPVGMELVLA